MSLEGKVALITGGGQGIGKAIAMRFLQNGMSVLLAEIDEEAGREAEAELKTFGNVVFSHTDVGNEDQVRDCVQKTVQKFKRLDVLVNNAGIFVCRPLTELSLFDWNSVMAVNLTGTFLCSKYATPQLRAAKGAIINIASTRAHMSEPNNEAYSASKGGVVALSHAMAMTLGPDIRVNCISPGWIEVSDWQKKAERRQPDLRREDHAQHPTGRVGTPLDVANMALFLALPENAFITGQNLIVDGGMTKKMIYV